MSKISNLVIEAQEAAPYMEKEHFLKVFGEDAIWIYENANGINEEIEEYMKTEQYREEHDEQEDAVDHRRQFHLRFEIIV